MTENKPDHIGEACRFLAYYLTLVPVGLFLILGLIWGVSGSVVGLLVALLGTFPGYILYRDLKKVKVDD